MTHALGETIESGTKTRENGMARYNGHGSWNSWNVALWIANDEGLYRLALNCLKRRESLGGAAREMTRYLPERTPDGAKYNVTCVKEALAGLRD